MQKTYKSPFPALNVHCRNEDVATDYIYSDTPAIDDGSIGAQFFVGKESMVCDVYGLKSQKQFVNTLQDNIRRRGAMNRLISDRAKVEISDKVMDILRNLIIGDWQSEPYFQHQNPAERQYRDVKRMTNTLLDRSGCPASCWLLALMYVCFILNLTACAAINYAIPLTVFTGTTYDISPLLQFHWWEPVYYNVDDTPFPSESEERRGHFVGIAEHVGHRLTYKILTDDTKKVIQRSVVRSAADPSTANLRADYDTDEEPHPYIRSRIDDQLEELRATDPNAQLSMPIIDIKELEGRTFLMDKDDGQRHRVRIVEAIEDHEREVDEHPANRKF